MNLYCKIDGELAKFSAEGVEVEEAMIWVLEAIETDVPVFAVIQGGKP